MLPSICSLFPTVSHSLLFVIPRRLSFPAVCRSPLLVVPRRWSFPVFGHSLPLAIPFSIIRCSRHWLFPLICYPSSLLSSAPPYLPTSSGLQAGWGCCVMWDWRWSSLDREGPLPPCEQRLAATAQGCIVRWVGDVRARCHPATVLHCPPPNPHGLHADS